MPITIETTPEQDAVRAALVDTFPDADFWIDPITTTDDGTIYVMLTEDYIVLDRAIYADGRFYAYDDDPDELDINFERVNDVSERDTYDVWQVRA